MEQIPIYGFPCVENPNDFTPDYESCTEKEIANWKAACEAWNRGERATDAVTNKGCYSEHNENGQVTMHVTRTSWGIGVNYVDEDEF